MLNNVVYALVEVHFRPHTPLPRAELQDTATTTTAPQKTNPLRPPSQYQYQSTRNEISITHFNPSIYILR